MSLKMPPVVDQEFEEQFVRCQICTHKFDQTERIPKILPCYHTFCLPCLNGISRTGQGRLRCPMCARDCHIGGTCKDLPTDHRIVSLLDWMAKAASNPRTVSPKTDTKAQSTCWKHAGVKTFFVCKTCSVPVCHHCTVLEHKDSIGHIIAEITDVLTKKDDHMTALQTNSKKILHQLGIKLDGLRKTLQALYQSKNQHTEAIKQKFIDFRHVLDKYEKDLITRESQRTKHQTDLLQAQHDSLYAQITQFQKLFDDFQKEDKDVTKLLTTANKISQQENPLQQIATTDNISTDDVTKRNEETFQTDMRSAESIWSRSELSLEDIERQIDSLLLTQTENLGATKGRGQYKGKKGHGKRYQAGPKRRHEYILAVEEVMTRGWGTVGTSYNQGTYIDQLECSVKGVACVEGFFRYFYLLFDPFAFSLSEVDDLRDIILIIEITAQDPSREFQDWPIFETELSWKSMLEAQERIQHLRTTGYHIATVDLATENVSDNINEPMEAAATQDFRASNSCQTNYGKGVWANKRGGGEEERLSEKAKCQWRYTITLTLTLPD